MAPPRAAPSAGRHGSLVTPAARSRRVAIEGLSFAHRSGLGQEALDGDVVGGGDLADLRDINLAHAELQVGHVALGSGQARRDVYLGEHASGVLRDMARAVAPQAEGHELSKSPFSSAPCGGARIQARHRAKLRAERGYIRKADTGAPEIFGICSGSQNIRLWDSVAPPGTVRPMSIQSLVSRTAMSRATCVGLAPSVFALVRSEHRVEVAR